MSQGTPANLNMTNGGPTSNQTEGAWRISMRQNLHRNPQLLTSTAGGSSCSIFRLPKSFMEANEKSYKPHIVSIGPFHHGENHLAVFEEHKWRLLRSLLRRTRSNGLELDNYIDEIMSLEANARECYAEIIVHNSEQFVQILVLDACFIVEVLRKVGGIATVDKDDPVFTMPWVIPFLMRDLLRIENQIPFFVLEKIFHLSQLPEVDKRNVPLELLAIEFFNHAMGRPVEVIENCPKVKDKHLLDLFRSSFITPNLKEPDEENPNAQLIGCVTKLRLKGVKFKPAETDSFLEIKFRNGNLEIPTITVDDFTGTAFLNCVALEQCCRHCRKHFTTYATFMDCLINTPRDVEKLCDYKIIENYFGTDEEVAHFFNGLGKEVAFDVETCYLAKEFGEVHAYCEGGWHVQWASFKNAYFSNRWSLISAAAAVVLLILTLAQTFFAVYSYFRPPKN